MLMELSKNAIMSPNEHQTKTETSQYFEPLRSNDNQSKNETHEISRPSQRQTILSFFDGRLGTKKPFMNPVSREDSHRKALAEVAQQTIKLLPGLLITRPDVKNDGHLCEKEKVSHLDPRFCPHLPPIKVQVVACDTIDAALQIHDGYSPQSVCILNMANARSAGGGFKHGSLAQEEALCYRSSLYFTLKHRHYPIPEEAAIYSPSVLVIRKSIPDGHNLLDVRTPADLPVIGVVSAAAICQPQLNKTSGGHKTYASIADRRLMEQKIRIILRTVIRNKHRKVVLGAFGCGAFGNPSREVASMWLKILQEPEFSGGWWEDVVFAVLDGRSGDNFAVFRNTLDGLVLS